MGKDSRLGKKNIPGYGKCVLDISMLEEACNRTRLNIRAVHVKFYYVPYIINLLATVCIRALSNI